MGEDTLSTDGCGQKRWDNWRSPQVFDMLSWSVPQPNDPRLMLPSYVALLRKNNPLYMDIHGCFSMFCPSSHDFPVATDYQMAGLTNSLSPNLIKTEAWNHRVHTCFWIWRVDSRPKRVATGCDRCRWRLSPQGCARAQGPRGVRGM